MNDPRPYPLGEHGDTEDGGPIVVQSNDVVVSDSPFSGIFGMESCRPPGVTVLLDAMDGDVVQPVRVLVVVAMEREPRMGGEELQRVCFIDFTVMTLPARDVARRNGPLVIIGELGFQALGDELDFAAVGAQLLGFFGAAFGVVGVRSVAVAAFGKPAQTRG